MTKFYLERCGFGKYQIFLVKPIYVNSKKYKELINSGAKIFNSREKAKDYANDLKNRN